MGSLVSAFHHDFPGFIVMSPHPRPREILKLFDGTPQKRKIAILCGLYVAYLLRDGNFLKS